MKVYWAPGELSCLAYRSPQCLACGVRLGHEQHQFRMLVTDGEPGALATGYLLQRVAAWKAEPLVCVRCPERVARPAP
jgi:hypothetical protein